MKKTFVLLLSLALLSGCSSLFKGPPAAKIYTLNTPQVSLNTGARLPVSLQVLLPQAAPGLDTERIALRKDDNQIDYYAGARWASGLNLLVQSLLVESFDNSHALTSVGNDTAAIKQDYSLLVEIRDFQMESDQSHQVAHVRLVAKLLQAGSQNVIMTRSYDEKIAAEENRMSAIMKAFDKAYQSTARKLVADINEQFRLKAKR